MKKPNCQSIKRAESKSRWAIRALVSALLTTPSVAAADSVDVAIRLPAWVDSILWCDTNLAHFLIKTLGDSQKVNYGSFVPQHVGPISHTVSGFPAHPTCEEGDIWTFSPDSGIAASAKGYEGEADNILSVYNRDGQGNVETLEFCGTPCRYRDVYWLDNWQFVFTKHEEVLEEYDASTLIVAGCTAHVTLYDLKADSLFEYKSALIPGYCSY